MTYRDDPKIAKKYRCKRWRELRKAKLLINPVCERCAKQGKVNSAYIIHHKEYITNLNYEDDEVFYNIENLESLCEACHNNEHFNKKGYYFDENGDIYESKSNR